MRERGGVASTRPLQLRPERGGGVCLADPPRALEISSLRVSLVPWASGSVERLCQNKPLAWRPGPPLPLPRMDGFISGPGEQASRRGSHHVRRSRGTGTGTLPAALRRGEGDSGAEARTGHGRAWGGRAGPGSPWFRGVRHKRYFPHSSRPGREGREAGSDATRSTVGAEPLPGRYNGVAPPGGRGEGKECHFESSPSGHKRSLLTRERWGLGSRPASGVLSARDEGGVGLK